jgi:hypothetical protein
MHIHEGLKILFFTGYIRVLVGRITYFGDLEGNSDDEGLSKVTRVLNQRRSKLSKSVDAVRKKATKSTKNVSDTWRLF